MPLAAVYKGRILRCPPFVVVGITHIVRNEMAVKYGVRFFETAVYTSLYAASETSVFPTLSKNLTPHFSFASEIVDC